MQNCKAAVYHPANACTDRCKWPGVCKSQSAPTLTPEVQEVPAEALDTAVDTEAAPKPKRGKKTREDA